MFFFGIETVNLTKMS